MKASHSPLPVRANLALASEDLFEPENCRTVMNVRLQAAPWPVIASGRGLAAYFIGYFESLHPSKAPFYGEGAADECLVLQLSDYHELPANGDFQRAIHELVGLRNPNYFYRFVADRNRIEQRFATLSVSRPYLEMYRDYTTAGHELSEVTFP